MDYMVLRRCRRGGYELLDEDGDYVGCTPTIAHARRFAEAVGASLGVDADVLEAHSLPDDTADSLG